MDRWLNISPASPHSGDSSALSAMMAAGCCTATGGGGLGLGSGDGGGGLRRGGGGDGASTAAGGGGGAAALPAAGGETANGFCGCSGEGGGGEARTTGAVPAGLQQREGPVQCRCSALLHAGPSAAVVLTCCARASLAVRCWQRAGAAHVTQAGQRPLALLK